MAKSTLKAIADELLWAMRPLQRAVSSANEFRALLHGLGWNGDGSPVPAAYQVLETRVSDFAVALAALPGDDPDPGEILDALEALVDLMAALRAITTAPTGTPSEAVSELTQSLLDVLLADYLATRAPRLYRLMRMTGVLMEEAQPAASGRPSYVRTWFDFAQIPKVLGEPSTVPARIYGWGTETFNAAQALEDLFEFFFAIGVPARLVRADQQRRAGYQPNPTIVARRLNTLVSIPFFTKEVAGARVEVGIAILELPGEVGALPGLIVEPIVPSGLGTAYAITSELTLKLRAGTDVGHTAGFLVRPNGLSFKYPFEPGRPLPTVGLGLDLVYEPPTPTFVLGRPNGTRIEVKGFDAGVSVDVTGPHFELAASAVPRDLALVLSSDEQDGFLTKVLGGGARIPLPMGLKWSSRSGLSFAGGNAFKLTLAPHLELGPVTIQQVVVTATGESDPAAAVLEVAGALDVALGPVLISVNGVGFRFRIAFTDGNLGPVEVSVGFKPSTGAGLAIDAGTVRGSGFLDFDSAAGRYTGALALEVHGFALSAIGILDAKLPESGYSFAAVISTEFEDGIPLGLGFTLNGVGGLVALNRRIDEHALKDALAGPGFADLFFPDNPLTQAARVVNDLASYFPVAEGRHVFGPAAKIGWGSPTLMTADVALLMEVPSPIKFLLLGKVHAALPATGTAELITLNADVLGILDFERKRLEVYARLRDSKVLEFAIEGGFGALVEWGDQPNFVVSIGGFHPRFVPPSNFLVPRRVRIPLGFDDNPRLDCTGYLAVTSNTAQIGAEIDLYAAAGWGLNISGYLNFDALFVFDPFSFAVELSAGVTLRRHSHRLAGIHLHGTLSGPAPWHVKGKACLSCWFFDLCVPFEMTFGGSVGGSTPYLDPWPALQQAIGKPENWSGDSSLGAHQSVTLAPAATTERMFDPTWRPRLKQKVVPLNRKITKYLGAPPIGSPVRYDISAVTVGGASPGYAEVKDWFAPDAVEQLTDDERLTRGAYEKMTVGVSLPGELTDVGHSITKTLGYDTVLIRSTWTRVPKSGFAPTLVQQTAATLRGSAANAARVTTGARKFAQPLGTPPKLTLADEGFVVASAATLMQQTGITSAPVARGDAYAKMADYLAANPTLEGTLQVVPAYELAA